MNLPIACTLTEPQLRERRQAILETFYHVRVSMTELEDGCAFTFPASSEALQRMAELVDMERQCCPFLAFKIVVEAAHSAMRLEVTGAKEAKKLIKEYFRQSR
jgi:Mn-dependent DtxR family transcriptional regulator